jgi:hypothetical protein
VKGGISVDANANDSRHGETPSLVYVNSSHEYVVFDPHKNEELVSSKHKGRKIQAEESGEFIVLSCYIFLSFKLLHILHLSYRSLPAGNCLGNSLRGVKNCCIFILLLLLQNICEKTHALFCFFPAPIGYTSIYGELPKLESVKVVSDIPFIPSDRPWETIFSGSSHVLPPLTKLCSTFLSSLLEKRTVAIE